MIIESSLELEIAGALHALLFDDNNKRKEQSIQGSTIHTYLKKLRRMDYINDAIRNLEKNGVVKTSLNTTTNKAEELKYTTVSPTERGEKFILAVVEPYWVYIPGWRMKYLGIQQSILPLFDEPDDWIIYQTLFEKASWRKDYSIEEDVARDMFDKGREDLPYFGKFKDKIWRAQIKPIDFRQSQTGPNKHPQCLYLQERFKPLAIGNFNAFITAKEYYRYFSQMYADLHGKYLSVHEFLKILKKRTGVLPKNLDLFFDHLISLDLVRISTHQQPPDYKFRVQMTLNSYVDSNTWEKWESHHISSTFNPQKNFNYQLEIGNSVRFNLKSGQLEIIEEKNRASSNFNTAPEEKTQPKDIIKRQHQSGESDTNKTVFVVHGRNEALRIAMFEFLKSIGLEPLEWIEAIKATKEPSPYVGTVLKKAFELAHAIVIMFTPDDLAKLRDEYHLPNEPEYEKQLMPQSRPNVIFEAGMAMGYADTRTVMIEIGDMKPFSDIFGRHVVRMNNSLIRREELIAKLEIAGCPVDKTGEAWKVAGDFAEPPIPTTENVVFQKTSSKNEAQKLTQALKNHTSALESARFKKQTRGFLRGASDRSKRTNLDLWDEFLISLRNRCAELFLNPEHQKYLKLYDDFDAGLKTSLRENHEDYSWFQRVTLRDHKNLISVSALYPTTFNDSERTATVKSLITALGQCVNYLQKKRPPFTELDFRNFEPKNFKRYF